VNQSALSLARICGPLIAGFIYQTRAPAAVYVAGAIAAIVAFALTHGVEPGLPSLGGSRSRLVEESPDCEMSWR